MPDFLEIQTSGPPDHHYFDDAIVSWDIKADGLHGTTGIIQPGFTGEFDIPRGGERVTLVQPEGDERIEFDILNPDGSIKSSLTLIRDGEIFVPEGKDRLTTPLGQSAVRYLCLYPGRPVESA